MRAKANLLKQKSYSVTLENRISEIRRKYHDLEHCISVASSTHAEEVRFRQVISDLKDRLDQGRLLAKNYEELEADSLGFRNTTPGAEYHYLYSIICDTSSGICHTGSNDTLPIKRTGFSHLANNWAQRIGGRDLGPLLDHCEAVQIPKKLTLVSLLVAGLFELVLEEVFPAFLAAESPLLDQYRKHIETQSKRFLLHTQTCFLHKAELIRPDGWNVLQRLDLISIRSLLSDREVKKRVFSEKSKRLSSLILQALSCFLPSESRDITQRPPHHEFEADCLNDMRVTLHHALKFKMELMMSVKRLNYLFFRPGTPFDADQMEVVESQRGPPAPLSQKVKICLLPALFTVSEDSDETGAGNQSSLRPNYTKALTEVMVEEVESLTVVAKAIVFL